MGRGVVPPLHFHLIRWDLVPAPEDSMKAKKLMASIKRAPNEALIRAMMTCDDHEGVCEMCAGSWPRNELTTVWIGQGNQEEGIALCRDCKVKRGDQ